MYVVNAVDEISLVRINQDDNFKNHNLINKKCITLKIQAVNVNEFSTKFCEGQFHQDNERSRRD